MDGYLKNANGWLTKKKVHQNTQEEVVLNQEQQDIKKYGRFRYLVAKHFLSTSLQEIDDPPKKLDIRQIVKLMLFLKTLEEIFPEDSVRFGNLGMKYEHMNEQLYKNTYVRER